MPGTTSSSTTSTILARLYYKSLLDLTDIYDGLGKKYGGWIPAAKSPIEVEGGSTASRCTTSCFPMLWRKDLFEANGLEAAGHLGAGAGGGAARSSPRAIPTGIAFSHCNDANLNWRSLMFSFGATETDPSGENPTIDSKEMREALRFAKALFDEGMTPEVFSWDDASDNRFLASGIAGWIHDAISAYRTTESTNPTVFKNTFVGLEPAGPGGKRVQRRRRRSSSWRGSSRRTPRGPRSILYHLVDNDKEGMIASTGYNMPFLNDNAKKPMPILGTDPKLQVLQDFPKIVAFFGYPGPYTPADPGSRPTCSCCPTSSRGSRAASRSTTR